MEAQSAPNPLSLRSNPNMAHLSEREPLVRPSSFHSDSSTTTEKARLVANLIFVPLIIMAAGGAAVVWSIDSAPLADRGWIVVGAIFGTAAVMQALVSLNVADHPRTLAHYTLVSNARSIFLLFWLTFIFNQTSKVAQMALVAENTAFIASDLRNLYNSYVETKQAMIKPDAIPLNDAEGEIAPEQEAKKASFLQCLTWQTVPYSVWQGFEIAAGSALVGCGYGLTSAPVNFIPISAGLLLALDGLGAEGGLLFANLRDKALHKAHTNSHIVYSLKEKIFIVVDKFNREVCVRGAATTMSFALNYAQDKLKILTFIPSGFLFGVEKINVSRSLENRRVIRLDDAHADLQKSANYIAWGSTGVNLAGLLAYVIASDIHYRKSPTFNTDLLSSLVSLLSAVVGYGGSKALQKAWDPEKSGPILHYLYMYICENPAWLAALSAICEHSLDLAGMPHPSLLTQLGLAATYSSIGLEIARINNFKREGWYRAEHSVLSSMVHYRSIFYVIPKIFSPTPQ